MTETKTARKHATWVIGLLLPLIIVLGNASIFNIRIAGIVLTYYRVLVPALFIVLVFIHKEYPNNVLARKSLGIKFNANKLLWVVIIWVAYGLLTILLFPYASVHEGMLEIMALILGAMAAFSIISVCADENSDAVLLGIKIAVYITLAIGIYELITANHLSTARVNDSEFIQMQKELFGEDADSLKYYVAMSIFHNENDFSAMLGVMVPFLICNANKGWLLRFFDYAGLCVAIVILYQNNAFIGFIAFMLGILISLVFGVKTWVERISIIAILGVSRVIFGSVSFGGGSGVSTMSETLSAQIDTAAQGVGSMYMRINTYKTTVYETFMTSKGMGFGAGSFTNYFSHMAEEKQMLLNPHCFWLEILSEYGLVIFTLFVAFLVILMWGVIKRLWPLDNMLYPAVCASGIALIVASVAPSSFIKTGYYWIPIALAVYLTDDWKMRKELHGN